MLKYLLIGALVAAGLAMFGFSGSAGNLVSYEELQGKLARRDEFVLLDVRTQEEFAQGHIAGALLLHYDEIDKKAPELLPDKAKPIIVYCRSGRRSAIALKSLQKLEYQDVKDFGGISRWQGSLER